MNLATERQIAKALAYQLGFSYVDLAEHPPETNAVILIPKEVALKRNCIAVAVEKNVLTVAMSDPLLFTLVQDLEFQTGYRIKQVVATRDEIVEAINRWYPDKALVRVAPQSGIEGRHRPGEAASAGAAAAASESGGGIRLTITKADEDVFDQSAAANKAATPETAPIIDMVELVIKSALKSRASDIHIEPTEGDVVVRQRLDGLLKEVMDLPKWVHEGVVARIKIMAGLDIAEKRLPQDGRIRATTEEGQEIDLRVSCRRCEPSSARRWCSACSIIARACRRSRISASRAPPWNTSATFSGISTE
jgi:type IV pilus assembly protein PilB